MEFIVQTTDGGTFTISSAKIAINSKHAVFSDKSQRIIPTQDIASILSPATCDTIAGILAENESLKAQVSDLQTRLRERN